MADSSGGECGDSRSPAGGPDRLLRSDYSGDAIAQVLNRFKRFGFGKSKIRASCDQPCTATIQPNGPTITIWPAAASGGRPATPAVAPAGDEAGGREGAEGTAD